MRRSLEERLVRLEGAIITGGLAQKEATRNRLEALKSQALRALSVSDLRRLRDATLRLSEGQTELPEEQRAALGRYEEGVRALLKVLPPEEVKTLAQVDDGVAALLGVEREGA